MERFKDIKTIEELNEIRDLLDSVEKRIKFDKPINRRWIKKKNGSRTQICQLDNERATLYNSAIYDTPVGGKFFMDKDVIYSQHLLPSHCRIPFVGDLKEQSSAFMSRDEYVNGLLGDFDFMDENDPEDKKIIRQHLFYFAKYCSGLTKTSPDGLYCKMPDESANIYLAEKMFNLNREKIRKEMKQRNTESFDSHIVVDEDNNVYFKEMIIVMT